MIQYLSASDIREIHLVALDKYGGAAGEHEPGSIEFMAMKPSMESFGQELYPGLFAKAAVYMEGFCTRQFFVDGNKRTAYTCAEVFLMLNGYQIEASDDETYGTVLVVANKEIDVNTLEAWLEFHAVKRDL